MVAVGGSMGWAVLRKARSWGREGLRVAIPKPWQCSPAANGSAPTAKHTAHKQACLAAHRFHESLSTSTRASATLASAAPPWRTGAASWVCSRPIFCILASKGREGRLQGGFEGGGRARKDRGRATLPETPGRPPLGDPHERPSLSQDPP